MCCIIPVCIFVGVYTYMPNLIYVYVRAKSFQSCLILCDPMNCSPPGSALHEILQERILEWVAMPSSRGSSQPGTELASLRSPALAGGFFTTSATWEASIRLIHMLI